MTRMRALKGPCAAVAFGSVLLLAAAAGGQTSKAKEDDGTKPAPSGKSAPGRDDKAGTELEKEANPPKAAAVSEAATPAPAQSGGLGALDPVGLAPVGKFQTSSAKTGFNQAKVQIAPPRKVAVDESPIRRMSRDRPPKGGVVLSAQHVNRLLDTPAYRKHLAMLADCRGYVAGLQQVKTEEIPVGVIDLAWSVSRTGTILETDIVAEGTTDPDVLVCLHGRMRSWRAPAPDRPYRVRTVFRFPEAEPTAAIVQ